MHHRRFTDAEAKLDHAMDSASELSGINSSRLKPELEKHCRNFCQEATSQLLAVPSRPEIRIGWEVLQVIPMAVELYEAELFPRTLAAMAGVIARSRRFGLRCEFFADATAEPGFKATWPH